MPAIAAAVITALGLVMRFMVAKILFVVGLDQLMDFALEQAFGALNALDGTVYAIVRLTRIPDAISVIGAAALVKHSLVYGAGKLMWVARGGSGG